MIKKFIHIPFIILCLVFFSGWGYQGHKIINNKTVFSFPSEMEQFRIWQQLLEQHASDADNRKGSDPDEAPKHYIDIDNYPGFLTTGYIPQNYDSAVALYGYSFVLDQGILPWAIITTCDSLTQAFSRRDWNKALLLAADLGHYVGDAHMPLHITRNYNGQYTGQTGIHSRYESSMINRYYTQIIFETDTALQIANISDFVFSFIYSNYSYKDSLLAADLSAKAIAGNTTSDLYYQKFWEFTGGFTRLMLKNSSYNLASLIYSSWTAAGKPLLITGIPDKIEEICTFALHGNYPNPFNPKTTISYSLAEPGFTTLTIYNINGEIVAEPVKGYLSQGNHSSVFSSSNLSSGIYFYLIRSGSWEASGKMILAK